MFRKKLNLLIVVLSLTVVASQLYAAQTRTFQITAKKYAFEPAVIEVNQGDRVVLEITSTDGTHGFGIDALNINKALPEGKTVVVEFLADKKGEFTIRCTQYCGWGHAGMKAKLIVS